jgi:hypothetical protein
MKKIFIILIFSVNFAANAQIDMYVAPLKIGNFWKYWDVGYKKNSNTLWYKSYRVIDTITINNIGYYKIKIQTNSGSWTGYYRLTDSGYYAAYESGRPEHIYYKKNAQYHDTWQQPYWNARNGILYSCVIDTGMIDVLGDTYFGKLIENTDSGLVADQEIWVDEIGVLNYRIELSEYQLIGWCIDGVVHGDTTLTAVNDISPGINKFELYQNYPNPFNPATNISYSITKKDLVQLKVFDMLGREIAVLVNGMMDAGEYTVQFHAGTLPSGVYLYRLQVGNLVTSRKFILLK